MGFVLSAAVVRQFMLLGILTLLPLLVVVLGIVPIRRKNAASAVIAEILAHIFAWGAVLLGLFVGIPKVKRVLADFGTELPAIFQWLMELNAFLQGVWSRRPALLLSLLLGIIAVDGLVLFALWQRNAKPSARMAWSVCMTAIPLLMVVIIEVAMFVSLNRLFHELS